MHLVVKDHLSLSFAVLALAGLLSGCGGGSSPTSGPPPNPLTNPDAVLFGSGRAQDASWHFYAMNPDGSGVVRIAALNNLNARMSEGIAVNQSGTVANVTLDGGFAVGGGPQIERRLVRLSDGVTLFELFTTRSAVPTVFAANSNGSRMALAGTPAPNDPYAIYLMAPDGTQKTRVYAIPSGTTISEIIFGPDDATLYFVALADNIDAQNPAGALYKLPMGAAAPTLLANLSAPIRSVHTSRDGTRLAFLSVVVAQDLLGATIAPVTLRADGLSLTRGATITIQGAFAVWDAAIASRADGFHILYATSIDGDKEIFDARLDGRGLAQVTFNAAGNATPGSRQATNAHRSLGGR